jgi:hypothetical protein
MPSSRTSRWTNSPLYNGHDLDDTIDLFHALKDRLDLREALGKQYLENNRLGFMSKSDAQIGEAIIKREVEKVTGEKVKEGEGPHRRDLPVQSARVAQVRASGDGRGHAAPG